MAGRKWNRTVRVDDEEWEQFNMAAFARGEEGSSVLRRLMRDYVEQEGERWV